MMTLSRSYTSSVTKEVLVSIRVCIVVLFPGGQGILCRLFSLDVSPVFYIFD